MTATSRDLHLEIWRQSDPPSKNERFYATFRQLAQKLRDIKKRTAYTNINTYMYTYMSNDTTFSPLTVNYAVCTVQKCRHSVKLHASEGFCFEVPHQPVSSKLITKNIYFQQQ